MEVNRIPVVIIACYALAVVLRLAAPKVPYLVTTEAEYLGIRECVHFELALLEQSEYLSREKVR